LEIKVPKRKGKGLRYMQMRGELFIDQVDDILSNYI